MTARLDAALARRTIVLILLFLWPLVLFGTPSYQADSVSYLKGGKVAVEFVLGKLHRGEPTAPAVAGPFIAKPSLGSDSTSSYSAPKGARSVSYSVAAYLLRWPGIDMTALALGQIVCAAFVAAVVMTAFGILSWGRFLAIGAVLSFATPLAVCSADAMPDIFAGFAVAIMAMMTIVLHRLSTGVRAIFAAIMAFAMTAHSSIPPLAFGMLLLGACVLLARGRLGIPKVAWAWAWLALPPIVGMIGNTAIGYIAFGEVSVAAKRYPVALTRSVVDGPARWYLEKQCVRNRYAVCEIFGTKFPDNINDFLFYQNGLNGRATPEQMDRIRAEEAEIVWNAALEYPGYELMNLSRNVVVQLFKFDLGKSRFTQSVALDSGGVPQLVPSGRELQPVLDAVDLLTVLVLLFGVGWFALNVRRLDSVARLSVALVVAGLIGNAVIVVAFSSVAPRYEARVIWVMALILLSLAGAHIRTRSFNVSQSPLAGSSEG